MADQDDDPSGILRELLSDANLPPKSRGGVHFHKDPDCKCLPCTARRRKEEALTESTGDGGGALVPTESDENQVIDADHPLVVHTLPKRTKGAVRQHVADWIKLRASNPDMTVADAAKAIGLSRTGLQNCISKAVREGWLQFEDPLSRIEYELVPKVVRNLNEFLDERDKTVTIETAKGTVFKQFLEAKNITQAPTTILALKLEMPETEQIVSGKIVGKPKITVEEVEE